MEAPFDRSWAEEQLGADFRVRETVTGGTGDLLGAPTEWLTSLAPAEVIETDRAPGPIWVVIAQLAVIVAASLVQALIGSVREHRRDYATLKAIGFTRRQILGSVTWQSMTPIVVSIVLALPLGSALGRWSWRLLAGRPGATRSSSPPAGSGKCRPARPTAVRPASAPPASQPARASTSSTSSPTLPGTGKSHLSIALGVRACVAGHRVAFATAAQWVDRLGAAHDAGRLQPELIRLGRVPLVIMDEVGYIPFQGEAVNLFVQLVSSRYERASVIVSSNKAFSRWGEVFGDDTVASAMIDRLVHHAEGINLKGDSYRLKGRDLGRIPDDER